jgi:transposase InsO family protein
LADITEHRTGGKLYLCAIKDVFSNRIVGYSINDRMKSRLAVDALNSAVARRGEVAGCILHTDRGSPNARRCGSPSTSNSRASSPTSGASATPTTTP